MLPDPVALAQALLRCRSVTPEDDGAQDVVARVLAGLGFTVTHLPFGTTPNLFARIGTGAPPCLFRRPHRRWCRLARAGDATRSAAMSRTASCMAAAPAT